MRTSGKKTPVAVLRAMIGLKDFEFAELIGCAPTTVHSLESGRMKLSENLADRIAFETGVSAEWLLAADATKAPFVKESPDEPFTQQTFEEARAVNECRLGDFGELQLEITACGLTDFLGQILRAAFEHKDGARQFHLISYKLERMFNEIADQLGMADDAWHALVYPEDLARFQRMLSMMQNFAKERVLAIKRAKIRAEDSDDAVQDRVVNEHEEIELKRGDLLPDWGRAERALKRQRAQKQSKRPINGEARERRDERKKLK